MNSKSNVRVRFAPSPTGFLHVGGARTALFNYLFAKKNNGQLILRIEDTDEERNQEKFLSELLQSLKWLGLQWDEGVDLSLERGEFGPYKQSQRKEIYQQYAQKLLEKGDAYYCFLTDEEIDKQKKSHQASGKPFRVQSPYRDWDLEKALQKKNEGGQAVIRFKMPKEVKEYKIQDLVRGDIVFPSDMVGDFVLIRSSGLPVYNFCCAMDDALMKITHVFRAEEHLPNTLRQLLIFEAFGFPPPLFGHLSIILDQQKKKLSKRSGAVSCLEYKKRGILPQALNNFLALMGWNPKDTQEIFNMKELLNSFNIEGLNASAAVFDEEKLKWINAQHIRSLSSEEFWSLLESWSEKSSFPRNASWRKQAFDSLKSSFSNLKEALEVFQLLDTFELHSDSKKIKEWDSTSLVLQKWKDFLEKSQCEYISLDEFQKFQQEMKDQLQIKGKFLFMPLRVAMIGCPQGLELNQVISLINRKELLNRVQKLLTMLK